MASIPLPEGARYEQLCFGAQQAAEKALKAVLLHCDIDFPFIHNLRVLAGLLPADLRSVPELAGVATLTTYAVVTRYPWAVDDDPVDKTEYDEAIRIASKVVSWAAGVIATPRQQAAQEL